MLKVCLDIALHSLSSTLLTGWFLTTMFVIQSSSHLLHRLFSCPVQTCSNILPTSSAYCCLIFIPVCWYHFCWAIVVTTKVGAKFAVRMGVYRFHSLFNLMFDLVIVFFLISHHVPIIFFLDLFYYLDIVFSHKHFDNIFFSWCMVLVSWQGDIQCFSPLHSWWYDSWLLFIVKLKIMLACLASWLALSLFRFVSSCFLLESCCVLCLLSCLSSLSSV